MRRALPGPGVFSLAPGRAVGAALALLALAAPFLFYPVFVMKALCFGLFACAFNLLMGYVGLVSFGHAAFFGWASYTTAYSVKYFALGPIAGILAGTAVAAAMGVVVGWLAIRRHGIYFAMVTLALAQMVYFVALEVKATGGEDGIQAVPRGTLFGFIDLDNPYAMYYFVLAIFLVGFAIIQRTIHSPFGQVLKAIRENEPRAVSLGYRTERYKLLAFILSATLSGLAGSTKSLVFQLASLTDVHWATSGDVVLMTFLGGSGTVLGPVIGAASLLSMENYLAELGSWVTVIQGVIFVVFVLVFRRGFVGEIEVWFRRRKQSTAARSPVSSASAARGPSPG